MIATSRFYEACEALFAQYPLAVEPTGEDNDAETMALMLRDGNSATFFILLRYLDDNAVDFYIRPWAEGDVVSIGGNDLELPDPVMHAVTAGVPLPRSGSVFGWVDHEAVSALIVVYAEASPESSGPGWSVMPLAEISQEKWPPFVGEHFFGAWFWEYFQSGKIISLSGPIAESHDSVFWVSTYKQIGSDCCVVERTVTVNNVVLGRGRYVDFRVFLQGSWIPSIEELLTANSKIDLATRFESYRDRAVS